MVMSGWERPRAIGELPPKSASGAAEPSEPTFPGGMRELEFVSHYQASVLRKPQVVADAALRTLVYANAMDRAILAGVVAEQLVEACRRLTAVWAALSDRRYSIARSLMRPLPGANEWRNLAQQAATFAPEQMVRELSLGEDALESAKKLRSQDDLSAFTELIAAHEAGSGMLLVPGLELGRVPEEAWLAGVNAGGVTVAASVGIGETDAAALADVTADLSSIARGFLGAYLGNRRSAGRRE
ncbi:hypothetical protein AYO38_09340 [bacterium SCGC AG-212-C10]|nr:hypothetical protein AYO38_09340 [bacterium SCGC AG-212-C10]